MKIVYVELKKNTEKVILKAFEKVKDNQIKFAEKVLFLPVILNLTNRQLSEIKKMLVRYYKSAGGKFDGEIDLLQAEKAFNLARRAELDLIVFYAENTDLSRVKRFFKSALKKGKQTT